MKKNIQLIVSALCLIALPVAAQISYVDIVTRTTNGATITGSKITITNVCTNAFYTITNPAAVTVGDPLPNAFTKVNTNFWWQYNYTLSFSNLWAATNTDLYGKLSAQASTLNSHSNTLKSFNGTNIIAGTINSNLFDVDTKAWLDSLGTTMAFDGGTITSDGSGNITAGSVKAGLKDNGSSTGASGYVPMANGDGTWTWGMVNAGVTTTITLIFADGTTNALNFTNGVLMAIDPL